MIEHENIIYISYISEIGGVETFAYELAKKYKEEGKISSVDAELAKMKAEMGL